MDEAQINSLLQMSGVATAQGGINWSGLIGGFVFGVIGFSAFNYGRKHKEGKPLGIGIALIGYSFIVTNPIWVWVIGIGLSALLFLWRD